MNVQRLDDERWRLTADTDAMPSPYDVAWLGSIAQPEVRWVRDGVVLGTGKVFIATREGTPSGSSVLECVVTDRSPWIRHDPYGWATFRVRLALENPVLEKALHVGRPERVSPREAPLKDVFRFFETRAKVDAPTPGLAASVGAASH